jgi:hypothetical protein
MSAQIDWVEGGRRKRAGIRQAVDHEHESWKLLYQGTATGYVRSLDKGVTFTSEQVRSVVHKTAGEPHHPNVWGAMFNGCLRQWIKLGWVEFTGQFLDATNSQAHRRAIRLYRRV